MNIPMNKREYTDWYIAEFKYPGLGLDRLIEEASVSYKCLKRTEELNLECKKLESLKDDYLLGIESLVKISVMEKAYKLLD